MENQILSHILPGYFHSWARCASMCRTQRCRQSCTVSSMSRPHQQRYPPWSPGWWLEESMIEIMFVWMVVFRIKSGEAADVCHGITFGQKLPGSSGIHATFIEVYWMEPTFIVK